MKNCDTPASFKSSRYFLPAGLFGLFIAVATNLVALYVFDKTHAVFFSEDWWSVWLPAYLPWFSFAVMGMAFWFGERLQR